MAGTNRVLITDHTWPDVQIETGLLEGAGLSVVDAPSGDEATLRGLAEDAVAIMTCFARVTPAVIDNARDLRVVARFGVGVDNIAVEAASARGVPVTYVPDYCVAEVAEHALALLLSLARGVVRYNGSVKGGGWDLGVGAPLRRIEGQTLGLIGCGRIGSRLAAKAAGLGLRVLIYDKAAIAPPEGARSVGLEELLASADFVSLHVPLTPETLGIVDESLLRRMKSSAFLINTARGGLVDTAALARALREGWIVGAGLDVLPQEPVAADDPLLGLDNVVLTPHVAFYSEESLGELRRRATQSVIDVLAGRAPEHLANAAGISRGTSR
ncbi:MAG TPA: C-terminal binding protein [Chloroflexota bacterium]|jgi:D-3-phosphoglycerate dehydrogenase|nr:C-terminal binding protein [Chloroflexota bacterium]